MRSDAHLQRHQGRRRHRDHELVESARLDGRSARAKRLAKRISTIVASAIEYEIKDRGWPVSRSPTPR